MRRDIGPDGNDIFETDTVGGVPAFTYMSVASRLGTQKGRQLMRPDYGADFLSYLGEDDPASSVRSEIGRALEDVLYSEVLASANLDANTIDVEISGEPEGWTIAFSISCEDGSVVNFPPFDVDGR